MGRLSGEQWEKARAEYEVRGISLGEMAREFGIATSSVSRKARSEHWAQGQMQDLANRKVAAIKEIVDVETQTQDLPLHFQYTLEDVIREKLRAEGALATFGHVLASKAAELAKKATNPEDVETLSRVHKNLAPPAPKEAASTTVNVNQQQAQGIKAESPRDALAEITRQAAEYPDESADS